MRYIRTKDEIVDISNYIDKDSYYQDTKSPDYIGKEKIINQADTIEELCDEFVGIDTQGHYIIHNNEFVEGARIIPLEKVNYYGAIWTDKGLIYVAKMNEKGELELL